ncbi:sensor histidine kinase [Vibrio sp. JPW-9-11-11]|uniref:sensor histidine kinase n=1 Tax=Vibrio sp. JPW-9-11-11 TaxID=1416532 RepID=UPI001594A770|nr:histidine kinase [Vibrio sp. JPW-9-11-11]NVD08941.1 sensor histidine kinase [Vibrio sp. JPW-9-11-11]
MVNISPKFKSIAKSLAYTTLFCMVIAFVTQSIWPSPYLEHLVISLGYGFSSVACSLIINGWKPDMPTRLVNLFSVTGAMVFGTVNAYLWLSRYEKFSDLNEMRPVVVLGFIFTATCFFYFYTHEQKLIAQKELETAKRIQSDQEKALLMSQLRQLQSQIEPHFLFNTLANVNALISQDPQAAQHMLGKLTELLRGTLNNSRQTESTLEAELDLLDAYLAIQKIRLGDRLNYQVDNRIERSISFAPLLLQPLVENAVLHGVEPKVDGGEVTIRVQQQQDQVLVEVNDTGVGLDPSLTAKGHGLGLSNVRQRLDALYGQHAKLAIKQNSYGGVCASLSIPLEPHNT